MKNWSSKRAISWSFLTLCTCTETFVWHVFRVSNSNDKKCCNLRQNELLAVGYHRGFHKQTELAIKAILASEALPPEKQNENKMWPQWALNLGPQPLMSNSLLSELVRHVLLGISLNCLLFLHHFNLGLRSLNQYGDFRSPKQHMFL